MLKTIIDNEYATLWYHTDEKIVHHKLHKFISGDHLKNVFNEGSKIFESEKASKWLSDDRNTPVLSVDDKNWVENTWLVQMKALGWKHWAIVLPEHVIGQMAVLKYAKKNSSFGVNVQMFSEIDKAMEWLKAQK